MYKKPFILDVIVIVLQTFLKVFNKTSSGLARPAEGKEQESSGEMRMPIYLAAGMDGVLLSDSQSRATQMIFSCGRKERRQSCRL